jgi:hypothetical protein
MFRCWWKDFFQSSGQSLQAGGGDFVKLFAMQVFHRSVKAFQDVQTGGGDASFHHAAVVLLADASDEAALFHAVEQASHVGIVRNHAVANAFAGQTMGLGAAKNAEDIVLGASQGVFFHKLFGLLAEAIRGNEKGDKDPGFEGRGMTFW